MVDTAAAETQEVTMVYELKVGMTCEGCSGAIERILGAKDEISKVECDIPGQKVLVEGKDGLDIEEMLKMWSEAAQKSVEFVSKTPKE